MTDQADSFIDEVTEELRRDRLYLAFRRYGWVALMVVLALVAGTAWYEYSRYSARQAAQEFGDAVLATWDAPDRAAAVAAIDNAETQGQIIVQTMLEAALVAEADDPARSAEILRVAAEAAQGARGPGGADLLGELALLKAVMEDPAMDLAARDAMLSRLSEPGAPFRLLALEQKAVALIGAGRDADAATLIRRIQEESGLSESMRRRLAATLITLGEEDVISDLEADAVLDADRDVAVPDAAPLGNSEAPVSTTGTEGN